jgi:cytochrome c-type biogenesis protein CcmH
MAIPSWATDARYPFNSYKQQVQFQSLLHDLRCPVCQNQDLADSNAGVAADLRQEVYRRVLAHQSDYEIIHYLTARYGEYILMTPRLEITTLVLWFGPIALLGVGLLIFAQKCIRRRPHE